MEKPNLQSPYDHLDHCGTLKLSKDTTDYNISSGAQENPYAEVESPNCGSSNTSTKIIHSRSKRAAYSFVDNDRKK